MRLVVTRDDHIAAGLDLLAREGHAALKVGTLCRELGVTSGSFYHYFGSLDGYVSELLAHWEQEKTQRLAAAADAEQDPVERIRLIKRLALGLPHDAEAAIRAWAHTNPVVAEMQERVDAERVEALRRLLVGVVGRGRRAERLAVMGMSLLVGLQQWRTPVDVDELAAVLDEFEALVLLEAGAGAR